LFAVVYTVAQSSAASAACDEWEWRRLLAVCSVLCRHCQSKSLQQTGSSAEFFLHSKISVKCQHVLLLILSSISMKCSWRCGSHGRKILMRM